MIKKKTLIWSIVGAAFAALVILVAYQYLSDPGRLTTKPEFSGLSRSVSGNILSSANDPAVRMTFAEGYTYIGGQTFILYGSTNVEQHFFVEERLNGTLKSLFRLQFESVLPDNDHTHDYTDSPLRLQIGDFDFFTEMEAGISPKIRSLGWPGTDSYLANQFLADKGYWYPDEYAYTRFVHLPGAAKRKELLIIFLDDLEPSGWTAKALREGGAQEDKWPEFEAAQLGKIKRVMQLERL